MTLAWRDQQVILERAKQYFHLDLIFAIKPEHWEILKTCHAKLPDVDLADWNLFPSIQEFLDPSMGFILSKHQEEIRCLIKDYYQTLINQYEHQEDRERGVMSLADKRIIAVDKEAPKMGSASHVNVMYSGDSRLLPNDVSEFTQLSDFVALTPSGLDDVLVLLQYEGAKKIILKHCAASSEQTRWLNRGQDIARFLYVMPNYQKQIWRLLNPNGSIFNRIMRDGMDVKALVIAYPTVYDAWTKWLFKKNVLPPFIREVTDFAAINMVMKNKDKEPWLKMIIEKTHHLKPIEEAEINRAKIISAAAQGMPEHRQQLWHLLSLRNNHHHFKNPNICIEFMKGFSEEPFMTTWLRWMCAKKGYLSKNVKSINSFESLERCFRIRDERWGHFFLTKRTDGSSLITSIADLKLFARWYPDLSSELASWVINKPDVRRWFSSIEQLIEVYELIPQLRSIWMGWLMTQPKVFIKQPSDLKKIMDSITDTHAKRIFAKMMAQNMICQFIKPKNLQQINELYLKFPDRKELFDRHQWLLKQVVFAIKFSKTDMEWVLTQYKQLQRLVWAAVNQSWEYYTKSQSYLEVLHRFFPNKKMVLPPLIISPDSIQSIDVIEGKSYEPPPLDLSDDKSLSFRSNF
ncbi:MAG: hypothetical protein ACON5A_00020 [Candidatus Comchoanobacterales bacterium]